MPHWRGLDGLRGIAILMVMGNHFAIGGFANGGHVGVTLFFVLSGFLITGLLLGEWTRAGKIRFREFYLRRALRLLPALFLMLLVVVPLMALREDNVVRATVPAVFYYANWAQVASGEIPVLGHTWSLSIEEQFYIAWPVLLVVLLRISPGTRWSVAFLCGAAAVSMALGIILWHPTYSGYYRVFYGTDTRADGLLLGCALAVISARAVIRPPWWLIGAAVIVGLFVTIAEGVGFMALVGFPTAVLASTVLVAAAATNSRGPLAWAPLVWIGSVSYALYLWHVPILALVRSTPLGRSGLGVVTALVLTVAAAVVSKKFVEEPALRLRARLSASQPRMQTT